MLGYRLQLAQQPQAYLEIGEETLTAYMKGMEVKRFPITRAQLSSRGQPRLSRVATKTPAVQTREVIVKVERVSADPSETVSSPDEIVSVNDMPETFALRLEDGSIFFITGNASDGLLNRYRKEWLKFRVGCAFLSRQLLHRPVRAGVIEMEPQAARHLFWLLRSQMGVIY
ncbi:MAG: hypothetical protein ACE15E_08360 [Acidobacteriota bacterium]